MEGAQDTEAGRGMDIDEEGAEGGVCKADMELAGAGGGPAGGRTVLKGWGAKGGCAGPPG